jgi:hypothetical protein
MILDPPFLATKGRSLTEGSGNRINRRFGVYPDEKTIYFSLFTHGVMSIRAKRTLPEPL